MNRKPVSLSNDYRHCPMCLLPRNLLYHEDYLILTEFSKNADKAAEAALMFTETLHADLLLFNTYIDYVIMRYDSGVSIYPSCV